MRGNIRNGLIVLLVIAGVAGVAWYRSARETAAQAAADGAANGPAVAGPQTGGTQSGELGPAPPPAGQVAETQTGGPATAPGSQAAAAKKLPRVVDLGADKCKACKDLVPILEELRKEYAGRVTVEFIDVWKNPKAGEPYKISLIPTQVFFDAEGKEVWRHVGFLPKADFVAKFKELGVK
ncbi:MAG: thioredoxin family protein [Planctomycetota bacterium]